MHENTDASLPHPNERTNRSFIKEIPLVLDYIPYDISITCCQYNTGNYNKSLFDEFGIPLPQPIESATTQRQAEFLSGRFTAILALHELGVTTRSIAIGQHRNPIWPANTIASITHSPTLAICAASYNDKYRYLGIDLEAIISIELAEEIQSNIITNTELTLLKETNFSFNKAFTLAYSAKESLFKALYPSTGYYFDFFAAEIIAIDEKNNCFSLVLCEDLNSNLTLGMTFTGHFAELQGQLLTSIIHSYNPLIPATTLQ